MTGYGIVGQEVKKHRKEYEELHNGYYSLEFIAIFDCKDKRGLVWEHKIEHCHFDHDKIVWDHDWWEGQTDIYVKYIIAFEEIEELIKENGNLMVQVMALQNHIIGTKVDEKIDEFLDYMLKGE